MKVKKFGEDFKPLVKAKIVTAIFTAFTGGFLFIRNVVLNHFPRNLTIENVQVQAVRFEGISDNTVRKHFGLDPIERLENHEFIVPVEYVVELYPQKGFVFSEGTGKIGDAYCVYKIGEDVFVEKMESENTTLKLFGEHGGVSPDKFIAKVSPNVNRVLKIYTEERKEQYILKGYVDICFVFSDKFDNTLEVYYHQRDIFPRFSDNKDLLTYDQRYYLAFSLDNLNKKLEEENDIESREFFEEIKSFMLESIYKVREYKE